MDDYSTYTGTVIDIDDTFFEGKREKKITIQKTKNNSQQFTERAIRFLEVLR